MALEDVNGPQSNLVECESEWCAEYEEPSHMLGNDDLLDLDSIFHALAHELLRITLVDSDCYLY